MEVRKPGRARIHEIVSLFKFDVSTVRNCWGDLSRRVMSDILTIEDCSSCTLWEGLLQRVGTATGTEVGVPEWFLAQGRWAGTVTLSMMWFSFSSKDEEEELFQGAALKLPRPKSQSEEDEDEVVRKSQVLPGPLTNTWGPFPTGLEKRSAVCWWPTAWTLCPGPCGSRLGAGRGQLRKCGGDGQVPLYSWPLAT